MAASEDGNIYKYNIDTGQLVGTFTHHSKTVTAFITTDMNNILSVSLDGSLRKFQLEVIYLDMSVKLNTVQNLNKFCMLYFLCANFTDIILCPIPKTKLNFLW